MGFFVKKTNERLQVDPIECGAVCLGIILEYFGYHATNLHLRDACSVSRRGAHAASIISGAAHYGLAARAKKLLFLEIRKIDAPAILFFDQSHFVVFEGYFLGNYYINDPALGRYKLNEGSFRERFSHVAILLQKTSSCIGNTTQAKAEQVLGKILMTTLGIMSGVLLGLLSSTCGFMLTNKRSDWMISPAIIPLSIVVLVLMLIACFLVGLSVIKQTAQKKIHTDAEIFEASIAKTPMSFYDDIPFSSFMSSYVNLTADQLTTVFQQLQGYFIAGLFCAVGLVLAFIAPILIFIIAIVAILYVGQIFLQKNSTSKRVVLSDDDLERASLLSLDMQAMGQSKLLRDGLLKKRLMMLPRYFSWHALLLISMVLLFYCGYLNVVPDLWHQGVITTAEINSIILAAGMLFVALVSWTYDSKIGLMTASFQRELAAQKNNYNKNLLPTQDHNLIEFNQVSFGYRGESANIIDAVSFSLKPKIAMVVEGNAGCGKSTLLKLLAGSLMPSAGLIYRQRDMRIVLIDEQTNVMNATLRENVTLYDDTISDEQVVWALQQSCALDLFYNRSLGLMATVDHEGMNLSASEKKRLLLAAALVHKPHVIILDDFFDGLDGPTSRKIFENLTQLDIALIFTATDEQLKLRAGYSARIDSGSVVVQERV